MTVNTHIFFLARLEPWTGQAKDWEIGICCFSVKHAVLSRKGKDWLARNQDNVGRVEWYIYPWSDISTCGVTYLPVEWHIYLWSDISTRGVTYLAVEWHIYPWSDISTCGVIYLPMEWHIYLWSDISTHGVTYLPVEWHIYPWSDISTCGVTYLPVEWHIYPWSDISTRRLFKIVSVNYYYKDPIKHFVLVQRGHHHHNRNYSAILATLQITSYALGV